MSAACCVNVAVLGCVGLLIVVRCVFCVVCRCVLNHDSWALFRVYCLLFVVCRVLCVVLCCVLLFVV